MSDPLPFPKDFAGWQHLREKFGMEDESRRPLYSRGRVLDHDFRPWKQDPSICDFAGCGAIRSRHKRIGTPVQIPASQFVQDYWAWMLTKGGAPEYFGGYDDGWTLVYLEHLESCALANDLEEPTLGDLDEFDGTDSPANRVSAVVGQLRCACGAIDTEWAVKSNDLTLGEIIYQVVQIGEPAQEEVDAAIESIKERKNDAETP